MWSPGGYLLAFLTVSGGAGGSNPPLFSVGPEPPHSHDVPCNVINSRRFQQERGAQG